MINLIIGGFPNATGKLKKLIMGTKGGRRPGAGRKPGVKSKLTIEREAFQAAMLQTLMAKHEKVAKALVDKALSGNVAAIKEIHNRILGKAVTAEMPEEANKIEYRIVAFDGDNQRFED